MPVRLDLTGFKNGRLTVISLNSSGTRTYWNCLCDCGKEFVSESYSIKTGNTISCGCFRIDNTRAMGTKHGLKKHPLYSVWEKMKGRCNCETDPAYHNYGGRGITVCETWFEDVEAFIKWGEANGWAKGLQLDREDNDLGYSPSNCRFVTAKVNSYNRRTNVKILYGGESLTTIELEKICGIPANRILRRIRDYGWEVERAVSTPVRVSAKTELITSSYQQH
jgi:hypothetical protein